LVFKAVYKFSIFDKFLLLKNLSIKVLSNLVTYFIL